MPETNPFLHTMAQQPDDDSLRLVCADWLDEHDDADRAELIRLQCGPLGDDAARRAEELIALHRQEWTAPFLAIGAEVAFRRGFPYFLKVDLEKLAENVSLLSHAPDWHLSLTREGNDVETPQVEVCAHLGAAVCANRIRGLNFDWAWYRTEELSALFTPAVIGVVQELRFGDDDRKLETLELLLRLPGLRPRVLGFMGDSWEGVGNDGCRLIANASMFASLRGLELPNNDIGPAGVAALAASPHLRGLIDLDLAGGSNTTNWIGTEGAHALAHSDNFSKLETLNLVFNSLMDDGLIALAESSKLNALRMLNVPGNGFTDEGMRVLARSPGMPALTFLNVCAMLSPGFTEAGLRELVNSPRMAKLTGLFLSGNRIGDAGAFALADSPASSQLTELRVSQCGIGHAGFVRMLESPYLAGVREFALYENSLTANEVEELKARYGDRVK